MGKEQDIYEQLDARLVDQIGRIDRALDTLERGDDMEDMSGLEDDIADLCDAIEKAPPRVARDLEPRLAEVIGGLEELARVLEEITEGEMDLEDQDANGR